MYLMQAQIMLFRHILETSYLNDYTRPPTAPRHGGTNRIGLPCTSQVCNLFSIARGDGVWRCSIQIAPYVRLIEVFGGNRCRIDGSMIEFAGASCVAQRIVMASRSCKTFFDLCKKAECYLDSVLSSTCFLQSTILLGVRFD